MRASLAVLVAYSLLAPPVMAQERYAPIVLRVPASAWALATGDALTAGRGTSDLLFYNPSALTIAAGTGLSLQRWRSASTAASLSHAVLLSGWGIGVGVRYLDFGGVEGQITHPSDLATRGPLLNSSLAATVGLARVIKRIRVGMAVSYAEERTPADRDGLATIDFGLGRDVGLFGFGLAVRNIGPSRVLGTGEFQPPTRASLGVMLRPRPIGVFFDAAATAEVAVARDGRVELAGGGELIWVPLDGWAVAARVGMRMPERVGELGARPYTAGIGISLDRFSLDYALDPQRGGAIAHRIGLRMR
ncbi:MAG: hypothetical protein ABR551_10870 [Gemmatimonadales bacterium]